MINRFRNGITPKSNFRYSLRGHVPLLDPETSYGYKGTYLGKKKVLTIGGAYRYEPDVAYSDTVNKRGSVDYKGWTTDLFFEYPLEGIGTLSFSGAYEDIDLGEAYKGANYYFRDQNLKLTLEYSRANFEKKNASTKYFNTYITQLQVIF